MNLYEILEIEITASELDIKKAYHRLALKYHPDKNPTKDTTEIFQNIHTAYQILSDSKARNDYVKMSSVEQYNFVSLLQKIFGDSIDLSELKHSGINFDKKDWEYLEKNYSNLFKALNLPELLKFFKFGKFPKKKIDITTTNTETTDKDEMIENVEYYFDLPIYYQKINNLNIILNLNVTIHELINNIQKKIKVKRSINGVLCQNTFIFDMSKKYVIFPNYGDISDGNYGNLIIKLHLPSNYYWEENNIIIEQEYSLYEMIYGININIEISNNNIIKFSKWIPSRDGYIIDLNQNKIKNYNLILKLILNYRHTPDKEKILLNYFS